MQNTRGLCLAVFLTFQLNSFAQVDFLKIEKELAFNCDIMANAAEGKHRVFAHEKFITAFQNILAADGSFAYPFDSLKWISKKTPPDRLFRIFTWELKVSETEHQYFGVMQMSDGHLFVLHDQFRQAEDVEEEYTSENWLGALYYNVMEMKPEKGQKYYMLFGVNKWSKFENRKLVDILFFTKNNTPVFGKPVFRETEKGEADIFKSRLVFTYASDAQMTLNYNPGMEMIVFDNLIPKMSRMTSQVQTLVPDGSLVGYFWDKKYWNKIDKLATEAMETAPRPKPILDQRKGKKIFGN